MELVHTLPSKLRLMLIRGQLDAAILPSSDLPCFGSQLTVLPAGCLAARGGSLLAKVFSQVPPEDLTVLWADAGSRSVAVLVQLLWAHLYRRRISLIPFDASRDRLPADAEAALIIGDRVVIDPPIGFERQLDPVAMCHEMTGLPFVFAIWGTLHEGLCEALYLALAAARAEGEKHLQQIAADLAPAYGWPVDLAVRCMTEELVYEFTDDHREGLEEFLELACEHELVEPTCPLRYYAPQTGVCDPTNKARPR